MGLGTAARGGTPEKAGPEGMGQRAKTSRAQGEGVKIDQKPGRSIVTTGQLSQTRTMHYLCSFALLGCQEVNGALQLLGCAWLLQCPGVSSPELISAPGIELHRCLQHAGDRVMIMTVWAVY